MEDSISFANSYIEEIKEIKEIKEIIDGLILAKKLVSIYQWRADYTFLNYNRIYLDNYDDTSWSIIEFKYLNRKLNKIEFIFCPLFFGRKFSELIFFNNYKYEKINRISSKDYSDYVFCFDNYNEFKEFLNQFYAYI